MNSVYTIRTTIQKTMYYFIVQEKMNYCFYYFTGKNEFLS
jgi:hypothetical protein